MKKLKNIATIYDLNLNLFKIRIQKKKKLNYVGRIKQIFLNI